MDLYSDYTMRMRCNISDVKGVVAEANYGCCLRDRSKKGGGYCMTRSIYGDLINTFFLDEENDWTEVLTDPFDLTAMSQPSFLYVGITTFYIVDETPEEIGTLHKWSGYKIQPWQAASYEDTYRFEKDDETTGYVYDHGATSSARWHI